MFCSERVKYGQCDMQRPEVQAPGRFDSSRRPIDGRPNSPRVTGPRNSFLYKQSSRLSFEWGAYRSALWSRCDATRFLGACSTVCLQNGAYICFAIRPSQ